MLRGILFQTGETGLAQGFVQDERGGVGEVERAQSAAHGDAERAVGVAVDERFGQAFCFLAEDQEVAVAVFDVGIAFFGFLGEVEVSSALGAGEEVVEVVVVRQVELVPIVEPRALELCVGYLKAHRLDYMQCRAGAGAGARDVARVLRDLGLYQNNIKHYIAFP